MKLDITDTVLPQSTSYVCFNMYFSTIDNNGFKHIQVLIQVVLKLNIKPILATKIIGSSFVSAQSEKLEVNTDITITPEAVCPSLQNLPGQSKYCFIHLKISALPFLHQDSNLLFSIPVFMPCSFMVVYFLLLIPEVTKKRLKTHTAPK